MADVDVDEVLVADPGSVSDGFKKLSPAQHIARPARKGFENVELCAGQQNLFVVDAHLTCSDVDAERAEATRWRDVGLCGRDGRLQDAGPAQHGANARRVRGG